MNTEFKGTPGKWYLQEFTDAYTNIIRCDNGIHKTLYIGSTSQNSNAETRYNALLMANAPAMLSMLQRSMEHINDNYQAGRDFMDEVSGLINQATTL